MDEAAKNIQQIFTTIRVTPITADHTIFFPQLKEVADLFGASIETVELTWKRLARVRGRNPALVMLAFKNYILQINALEIIIDTHYRELTRALKEAEDNLKREEDAASQPL